MGRILGIDPGRRHFGFAVTDELGKIPFPLCTIKVKSKDELLKELKRLREDYKFERIVIGLPIRTDGKKGTEEESIRQLGKLIEERLSIKVIFQDERYTSKEAEKTLKLLGKKAKGAKELVHKLSATLILSSYLEKCSD